MQVARCVTCATALRWKRPTKFHSPCLARAAVAAAATAAAAAAALPASATTVALTAASAREDVSELLSSAEVSLGHEELRAAGDRGEGGGLPLPGDWLHICTGGGQGGAIGVREIKNGTNMAGKRGRGAGAWGWDHEHFAGVADGESFAQADLMWIATEGYALLGVGRVSCFFWMVDC